MDLENMTLADVEARIAELDAEVRASEDPEAIEKATEERKALNERREELKALETRKAKAMELQNGATPDKIKEERKDNKKMSEINFRESLEYGKAFLRGIKTDDYSECRKLMTENGTGADSTSTATVPVPTLLDAEIRNAWETYTVASLVKKTYQKGIVKCVFEVSATGATVHVEGSAAPEEEKIVLGTVTLAPANIKKWITVTDEALEGTTVDTIGYLYKEIAQKIVEEAENEIITNIKTAQATTDATHPGVPVVNANIDVDTILKAEAELSGQARNLNIVMNRQTYPAFMKKVLEAGYAIDVFDGLKDKIAFSDKLDAYTTSASKVYVIIGDFGYGYQCNFPNGNDVTIKKDDLSLAEQDLVKLVGKQYVGHGVIAPKAFVCIKSVQEG